MEPLHRLRSLVVAAGAVQAAGLVTEGDRMDGARHRGLRYGAAVVLLAAAGVLAAPAGAQAAAATGDVYVVQAIVDKPVGLELDGRQVAASAQPKTIVGPIKVPAGQHVLVVRNGATTITSARFASWPDSSIDVVPHPAADAAMTPRARRLPQRPEPGRSRQGPARGRPRRGRPTCGHPRRRAPCCSTTSRRGSR